MALGGGTFVTQNKKLPGSYINIVSAAKASATLGERGVVAIALPIGIAAGTVIELTNAEFIKDSKTILGYEYGDVEVIALREIFYHSNKVFVYDLGAAPDGETTTTTEKTVAEALTALEPYDFNVLCAYTGTAEDVAQYIAMIKTWRDDFGKKCQLVVYNQEKPDYEGIVNVVSTVSDADAVDYALVPWVAGAIAGANVNESVTNMIYDGEYTVITNHTQTQLEKCIDDGQFVFHLVYGDVRVLTDINSLVTTTMDKGDDFKSNQTIRIIDQIANDIAKLFNTKYLGKYPNNASNRLGLWGDIVAHHKQLEALQAIENFDSSLLTVEQGNTKKAVVVNDVINAVNCMEQLYLTVVVN